MLQRFSSVHPLRFERTSPSADAPDPAPPPRAQRPPPREKTPLEKNEYAAFAAQLAARSERLRAGVASSPPAEPPQAPQARPAEVPRHRYALSRLAVERPARLWLGGLLLASLSVGVLAAAWSGPDQPASVAPAKLPDRTKVERSRLANMADSLKEVVPAPASIPELAKELQRNDQPRVSVAPAPPAPAPPPQAGNQPLAREEIRELQMRLKAAGFDPGPADGALGPRTTAALHKYGAASSRDGLSRLRAESHQSAEVPRR